MGKKLYIDSVKQLEDRIPVIIKMWNNHTLQEIANELGVSKQRICQISFQLRKNGLELPRKTSPKLDYKKLVNKYKHLLK
jgi:transposase